MVPPDAPTVTALPHARTMVLLHSQVTALPHVRRMPLALLFPSALTALLAHNGSSGWALGHPQRVMQLSGTGRRPAQYVNSVDIPRAPATLSA